MNATQLERVGRLVDRQLYAADAQYHAEVRRIEHLLRLVEMALEDEMVDPLVVERVLTRLAYGTPSGADAYERVDYYKRMLDQARLGAF